MTTPRGGAGPVGRRRRRLLALGALIGLGLVLGWSSAAGATPANPDAPQDPIPPRDTGETADCLKAPGDMFDSNWDYLVFNARIQSWTLGYLGVSRSDSIWDRLKRGAAGMITGGPIGAITNASTDVTDTVHIRVPHYANGPQVDWYIEQAKKEAEKQHNCALARQVPTGACSEILAAQGRGEEFGVERDGVSGLLPDGCWGNYPSDSFDIHYDNGGFFSWDRKIWAGMTGIMHTIGKGAIQITLSLIGWAFVTFQIEDFSPVALVVGAQYDAFLIGPFDLEHAAWLVLLGYAAITALRGKLALAGGEIVVSIVLVSLATGLMANREGYLQGASDTIDKATAALLATGNGQPATDDYDVATALEPMQRTIHVEFVERPFDYIHWGKEISGRECLRRRRLILWAGVNSDGGWAQRFMAHGDNLKYDENDTYGDVMCRTYAEAMGEPNGGRMLAALVTAVVAVGVALVLGGCSLTMIVAKVLLMLMFAVAPFAALAAILPGSLRRMAWTWVACVAQCMLAAGGMSFVLSFLLLAHNATVTQLDGLTVFRRWLVLLVIVLIVYLLRQRLVAGSKTMATNLSNSLTRLSPAAAHWQGGDAGFNFQGADRAAAMLGSRAGRAGMRGTMVAGRIAGRAAAAPVMATARHIQGRYQRRDAQKRALANLINMDYFRNVDLPNYKGGLPTKVMHPGGELGGKGNKGGKGGKDPGGGGGNGPGGRGGQPPPNPPPPTNPGGGGRRPPPTNPDGRGGSPRGRVIQGQPMGGRTGSPAPPGPPGPPGHPVIPHPGDERVAGSVPPMMQWSKAPEMRPGGVLRRRWERRAELRRESPYSDLRDVASAVGQGVGNKWNSASERVGNRWTKVSEGAGEKWGAVSGGVGKMWKGAAGRIDERRKQHEWRVEERHQVELRHQRDLRRDIEADRPARIPGWVPGIGGKEAKVPGFKVRGENAHFVDTSNADRHRAANRKAHKTRWGRSGPIRGGGRRSKGSGGRRGFGPFRRR